MGELLIVIVIPLAILFGVYRLGYRVGKSEGRLQGRDEAAARASDKGTAGSTRRM